MSDEQQVNRVPKNVGPMKRYMVPEEGVIINREPVERGAIVELSDEDYARYQERGVALIEQKDEQRNWRLRDGTRS